MSVYTHKEKSIYSGRGVFSNSGPYIIPQRIPPLLRVLSSIKAKEYPLGIFGQKEGYFQ